MAYINTKRSFTGGIGAKDWIPVNRWVDGDYSVIVSGTGTIDLQGTLIQVNRNINGAGETPGTDDIFDIVGATTLVVTPGSPVTVNITDTPLEALRANQTAGAGPITLHVAQNGMGAP